MNEKKITLSNFFSGLKKQNMIDFKYFAKNVRDFLEALSEKVFDFQRQLWQTIVSWRDMENELIDD